MFRSYIAVAFFVLTATVASASLLDTRVKLINFAISGPDGFTGVLAISKIPLPAATVAKIWQRRSRHGLSPRFIAEEPERMFLRQLKCVRIDPYCSGI